MDILVQSRRDVKDMDILESLRAAGALRSKDNPLLVGNIGFQSSTSLQQRQKHSSAKHLQKQEYRLEKERNALMVVASLIATMAFQAGLNPPGGVWQGDSTNSHQANSTSPRVGSSIMAYNDPIGYELFHICNTIGFIASLSIILLLISGLPFKARFFKWMPMVIMWIAVSAMTVTYVASVITITPDYSIFVFRMLIAILSLWAGLMALLILGHIIRLIRKIKRTFWAQR